MNVAPAIETKPISTLRNLWELRSAIRRAAPGDRLSLDSSFVADVEESIVIDVPGLCIEALSPRNRRTAAHFTGSGAVFEVSAVAVRLRNLSFRGAQTAVYCTGAGLTVEDCRMFGVGSGVVSLGQGVTTIRRCEMRHGRVAASVAGGALVGSALRMDQVATAVAYQGRLLMLDGVDARNTLVAIRARELSGGSVITDSFLAGSWRALQIESDEGGHVELQLSGVTLRNQQARQNATAIEVRSGGGSCGLNLRACELGGGPSATQAWRVTGGGIATITCEASVIASTLADLSGGGARFRCLAGCLVEEQVLAEDVCGGP